MMKNLLLVKNSDNIIHGVYPFNENDKWVAPEGFYLAISENGIVGEYANPSLSRFIVSHEDVENLENENNA